VGIQRHGSARSGISCGGIGSSFSDGLASFWHLWSECPGHFGCSKNSRGCCREDSALRSRGYRCCMDAWKELPLRRLRSHGYSRLDRQPRFLSRIPWHAQRICRYERNCAAYRRKNLFGSRISSGNAMGKDLLQRRSRQQSSR